MAMPVFSFDFTVEVQNISFFHDVSFTLFSWMFL